jgi:hypothetical protein
MNDDLQAWKMGEFLICIYIYRYRSFEFYMNLQTKLKDQNINFAGKTVKLLKQNISIRIQTIAFSYFIWFLCKRGPKMYHEQVNNEFVLQ